MKNILLESFEEWISKENLNEGKLKPEARIFYRNGNMHMKSFKKDVIDALKKGEELYYDSLGWKDMYAISNHFDEFETEEPKDGYTSETVYI